MWGRALLHGKNKEKMNRTLTLLGQFGKKGTATDTKKERKETITSRESENSFSGVPGKKRSLRRKESVLPFLLEMWTGGPNSWERRSSPNSCREEEKERGYSESRILKLPREASEEMGLSVQ